MRALGPSIFILAFSAAIAPSAHGESLDSADLPPIVVVADKEANGVQERNRALDALRAEQLLPTLGASTFQVSQDALQALPQGANTPLDKVLLQTPGVSYDSAVSNPDFHVRNEYANVQYRIDGIQLPDGVSALGTLLDTGFIDSLRLLDGALPAQYGLRTAGVIDITTRSEALTTGTLDLYGGSWNTLSPRIDYGGSTDRSQFFGSARYLQSAQGLENATPAPDPIHDRTTQERLFGYGSTLIGDSRLTYLGGGFVGRFQIPDVAGQQPLGDFGPQTLSSTRLDENETDRFFFGVVALQSHRSALDSQISLFARYATVDFEPDVVRDLAFNDVAAQVQRRSMLGGVQADASYEVSAAHTLRGGLIASVEKTWVKDLATVLPLAADGTPLPDPVTVNDATTKLGLTAGAYVQDEWRLRPDLTVNAGARFDAMRQFVSASQWSPRLAVIYTPRVGTTLHAGAARYFTPPMQAQSTPNDLALFQGTTQQPVIGLAAPVRPERATYLDVGIDHQPLPELSVGVDAYYKRTSDALDDGQFGQAVVLSEYNYAHGFSRGVEFKLAYAANGWRAYLNLSHAISMVKQVVSNQYLIDDPVEFAYIASHYVYTSDAQTVSGSWGASYRLGDAFVGIDAMYGSGLREGFANEQHSPGYTQWNVAAGRAFHPWDTRRPLTLRVSAVNLFDRSYLLRGATGIGEFAPQYGPRRGVFVEMSQQF